ncbi:MAG: 30S ribosomal protein S20 [Candidatus Omnitrophica bacterium]|nr:30S ribosomal protein S20 [Candidatus Omnitrophota bacterium]
MAHRRASIKKIRVDRRRYQVNLRTKSELKTVLRKLTEAFSTKDAAKVKAVAQLVYSKLDKAVKKGILHDNTASRRKSRIQLRLNKLKA